ncbi:hypothetical protein [Streptomyces sp. NPDC001568]|uniref:hypothetical protein n=1 Tax=Streptomyces sp. NPDC001568 TaxID=3364588 RepID=UPI00368E8C25
MSVAGGLGVSTETLRNWIRAADGRRPGAHAAPPTAARTGGDDVQAELTATRKRIVSWSRAAFGQPEEVLAEVLREASVDVGDVLPGSAGRLAFLRPA